MFAMDPDHFGISEDPKGWCTTVADEVATGFDRFGNPLLGNVVRHGQVEVDAIALWPWSIHLLEPKCRADAARSHL